MNASTTSSGTLLYAQSGGVTAVINASAAAVIQEARSRGVRVLGAHNGIIGALREALVDTSSWSDDDLNKLAHTPGGVFGSCRYKLPDPNTDDAPFRRLLEVCRAHDVRWLLYNGGNDSADTAQKIAQFAREAGTELRCVAVPKTVDNDLVVTDNCPGFGSIAKYTATSMREATLDVMAMSESSTKVFIMEVMGRHAGWVAASAVLARTDDLPTPQVILFPEITFDAEAVLAKIQSVVARDGWCSVAISEGVRDADGKFLADMGLVDKFGHKQLGGAGSVLAGMVQNQLGIKVHWAMPDYLQRSARHIASATDFAHAQAVGKAAVDLALSGQNEVMPVIRRTSNAPYAWDVVPANLVDIANREKTMPREYITEDGFGITEAGRTYLAPLIQGESYPAFADGIPDYFVPEKVFVDKQLGGFEV